MDVELVELVPKNFPEGADRREGSFIFAKAKIKEQATIKKIRNNCYNYNLQFLSSLNIFDVTDDSGLNAHKKQKVSYQFKGR